MTNELEDTGEQTDRNIKRFIHRWKPGQEKQMERILKRNYQENKILRECYICLIVDERMIWTLVDMCEDDVRRYADKYRKLKIVSNFMGKPSWKENYYIVGDKVVKGLCDWCGKPKIKIYTVNIRVCLKCLHKNVKQIDENYLKNYKRGAVPSIWADKEKRPLWK